jgi:hypothetical protein
MQLFEEIEIQAPAGVIFGLYANVAQWPTWDPEVKAASIEGPFVSGAKGVVHPHGGPKSAVVFTSVTPNQSYHAECKLPLCKMRFEQLLTATATGTKARHTVVFEGLLAPIFGRLIGGGMKKTLPKVMVSLKEHAERLAG